MARSRSFSSLLALYLLVPTLLCSTSCTDSVEPPGESLPPEPVNDFEVIEFDHASATLRWTVPGAGGNSAVPDRYDVRRSGVPITTLEEFEAAEAASAPPDPLGAGTVQEWTWPGLASEATHYFSIRSADRSDSWSDISNSPTTTTLPDGFFVWLDVVHPNGEPVPGLEVTLHTPIPGIVQKGEGMAGHKKAATTVDFDAPEPANARMEIYDLEGRLLRILIDMDVAAGQHRVRFDGRDDAGDPLRGTHVLRAVLTATDRDTGEELFSDSIYIVLYTGIDAEQQQFIGTTDATGRVETRNAALFPQLSAWDLPPMNQTDEAGNPIQTFSFTAPSQFRLTDPDLGTSRIVELMPFNGPNMVEFEWDGLFEPAGEHESGVAGTSSASRAARASSAPWTSTAFGTSTVPPATAHRMGDVIEPGIEWQLYQNYPNPFN